MTTDTKAPIIVAMDYNNEQSAIWMANLLNPKNCRLKVGKELFGRCGPPIVDKLQQKGFEIFLDLKFHDIPNTVAAACRIAADQGVWMVNMHAQGCRPMTAGWNPPLC